MKHLLLILLLSMPILAIEQHGLRNPEYIDIGNSTQQVDIIKDDVIRLGNASIAIVGLNNQTVHAIVYPGSSEYLIPSGGSAHFDRDNTRITLEVASINIYKVGTVRLIFGEIPAAEPTTGEIPTEVEIQTQATPNTQVTKNYDGWYVMAGVFIAGLLLLALVHLLVSSRL